MTPEGLYLLYGIEAGGPIVMYLFWKYGLMPAIQNEEVRRISQGGPAHDKGHGPDADPED
jgi:hypothetical protein